MRRRPLNCWGTLKGRESRFARRARRDEREAWAARTDPFSFPSCFSRGPHPGGRRGRRLAMASIQTDAPVGGSKAAAISNHVVRTMSEYTGRGPTRARTHLNDNLVTVVLQDTLTK